MIWQTLFERSMNSAAWPQFEATFWRDDMAYETLIKNPRQPSGGVSQIMVDETLLGPEKMVVPLVGDGKNTGCA